MDSKENMNKKHLFRILGMGLFLIGIVLGMALFGGAAWADLEANFYGFADMGGKRLTTIDCPILMTTSDIATIGATFKNPNDTPINFMVRVDISNRGLFRSERLMLSLEGHKSKKVTWNVTSDDIDLRNFIFAEISNYPAQKVPFSQAYCGIIAIDLPQFTGKQIFSFAIIVIIVGIVGGLILWEAYGLPLTVKLSEITRAMRTLGVLVLLGMLVSFLGYWMLGVLLFAGAVLAIGVILGFLLSQ
jgi:hypothetical protein